jgi:hypothetical protein
MQATAQPPRDICMTTHAIHLPSQASMLVVLFRLSLRYSRLMVPYNSCYAKYILWRNDGSTSVVFSSFFVLSKKPNHAENEDDEVQTEHDKRKKKRSQGSRSD